MQTIRYNYWKKYARKEDIAVVSYVNLGQVDDAWAECADAGREAALFPKKCSTKEQTLHRKLYMSTVI